MIDDQSPVAILFSGGTESTALYRYYRERGIERLLLYLRFGLAWEDAELAHLRKYYPDEECEVIDCSLSNLYPWKESVRTVADNILPNRNLLLCTVASTHLKRYHPRILRVAMGTLGDNRYPDTSREFFDRLEELLQLSMQEPEFRIETPFYGWRKGEVYRKYLKDTPWEERIFTCHTPIGNEPCGTCMKCQAFVRMKEG